MESTHYAKVTAFFRGSLKERSAIGVLLPDAYQPLVRIDRSQGTL